MLFMLLYILHFLFQIFFSYFLPLKPRCVLWSENRVTRWTDLWDGRCIHSLQIQHDQHVFEAIFFYIGSGLNLK